MHVGRSRLRRRILSKKPLVAGSAFIISQLINERISPVARELREISVHQHYPLHLFSSRIRNGVPTSFRCDSGQFLQLLVGISLKSSSPSFAVFPPETVPVAIQCGVSCLPGLIVDIQPTVPADIIMRVGEVCKRVPLGKRAPDPAGTVKNCSPTLSVSAPPSDTLKTGYRFKLGSLLTALYISR